MTIRNSHTYDNLLLLKDAGSVSASGAATVASVARVLDLGVGHVQAQAVVDTSAIDITTGDETYRVSIQGCNAIGFGSNVVELGSASILAAAGRTEVMFSNEQGGTVYQYVRAYMTLAGTTPSFNATIYIAKL